MIPHGCDKISEQLASQADGVAYLEDHRTWPRGGERVSAEIFVPQRVLRVDLVAFQAALEALSPAHNTDTARSIWPRIFVVNSAPRERVTPLSVRYDCRLKLTVRGFGNTSGFKTWSCE
jgi:hypothetical protein